MVRWVRELERFTAHAPAQIHPHTSQAFLRSGVILHEPLERHPPAQHFPHTGAIPELFLGQTVASALSTVWVH